MGSTYDHELPKAFPYMFELELELVIDCIYALIDYKAGGNGSSWAITSDSLRRGHRKLWLSRVSFEFLSGRGILAMAEPDAS